MDGQYYINIPKEVPLKEVFVRCSMTERLVQVIRILVTRRKHVLLVGQSGCGKTSLVQVLYLCVYSSKCSHFKRNAFAHENVATLIIQQFSTFNFEIIISIK